MIIADERRERHATDVVRQPNAGLRHVEAEAAPAAGTILRLKCGATTVDGRVAWSERGWFGVEFETPLLASEVVDPAGAKLAVSAPRSYRAGDVLE